MLCVKRRSLTGRVILPFSMRNVPSRVIPVITVRSGCTSRTYQNRVTYSPRDTEATMSFQGVSPASIATWRGSGPQVFGCGSECPVDATPSCSAVGVSYTTPAHTPRSMSVTGCVDTPSSSNGNGKTSRAVASSRMVIELAHQPLAHAHEAAVLLHRQGAEADPREVLEQVGDRIRREDRPRSRRDRSRSRPGCARRCRRPRRRDRRRRARRCPPSAAMRSRRRRRRAPPMTRLACVEVADAAHARRW